MSVDDVHQDEMKNNTGIKPDMRHERNNIKMCNSSNNDQDDDNNNNNNNNKNNNNNNNICGE